MITAASRSERSRMLIEEVNRMSGSYHQMDFGHGLVVNGQYDMAEFLPHYGLPQDLSGQTVLDIGTASGFFAFECARRGARVTAIDIWPGIWFEKVRDALGLDVKFVQVGIHELDESFGQFDLVICGSVLLHLSDIIGATRAVRKVCAGQAIVATSYAGDAGFPERPLCEFVGSVETVENIDFWTYWNLTSAGLQRLLKSAGFASTREVSRFPLGRRGAQESAVSNHVVVHASVK